MIGIPRWFMPLWCLVMPITSFLIVPSIQGTIPAYLMAFASLALVLPSRENGWFESQRAHYLCTALLLAGIWLLLLFLSRALTALREQTLPVTEWELLLVDNGSENPPEDLVDLARHPTSRVVREPEPGLTPARLRALAEVRGELITFVDDDKCS